MITQKNTNDVVKKEIEEPKDSTGVKYHAPSKERYPEENPHHMLFVYFHFRDK